MGDPLRGSKEAPPAEPAVETGDILFVRNPSRIELAAAPEISRLKLFVQGALFTAIGVGVTSSWDFEQAGLFSIFLASAALTGPMNALLFQNRHSIWVQGKSTWQTNRTTVLSILALFFGIALTYGLTSVILGEVRTLRAFRFVLSVAGLGRDTILTRRFGTLEAILGHNLSVLGTLLMLAFLYRSYGALLALSWNACVWGLVVSLLINRGLTKTQLPMLPYLVTVSVAVMPHLVLEALGYVLGTLAAIFASKAVGKYPVRSREFRRVAVAVTLILCAAILALLLGAVIERAFPERLLRDL